MYNPHTMYLVGKSIEAERLKEAEQQRLINLARSQKGDEPVGDRGFAISLAARTAIVIALAVVLNIAG